MSAISQFGQGGLACRRPTLAELQSIVGFSTLGTIMHTDTNNQTAAFIDTIKLSTNGSRLICKSAGVAMIVAPSTTQVGRTWYCRDDAKLIAQQITQTCCTQWFVPTIGQLQNPGYACRTFWDTFSSRFYWSSTERNASYACLVGFGTGGAGFDRKSRTYCVRAFRCVTY